MCRRRDTLPVRAKVVCVLTRTSGRDWLFLRGKVLHQTIPVTRDDLIVAGYFFCLHKSLIFVLGFDVFAVCIVDVNVAKAWGEKRAIEALKFDAKLGWAWWKGCKVVVH